MFAYVQKTRTPTYQNLEGTHQGQDCAGLSGISRGGDIGRPVIPPNPMLVPGARTALRAAEIAMGADYTPQSVEARIRKISLRGNPPYARLLAKIGSAPLSRARAALGFKWIELPNAVEEEEKHELGVTITIPNNLASSVGHEEIHLEGGSLHLVQSLAYDSFTSLLTLTEEIPST